MKIYHNPRCSKSRETLALIEAQGQTVETILYLKQPPSETELEDILKMLGIKAEALLRKKDAFFKEQFADKTLTNKDWIAAMVANPKLIERPIVVHNNKAIIGRPPEKVLEIL